LQLNELPQYSMLNIKCDASPAEQLDSLAGASQPACFGFTPVECGAVDLTRSKKLLCQSYPPKSSSRHAMQESNGAIAPETTTLNGVALPFKFQENLPNFIGGAYTAAESADTIDLTSPHDGEFLAKVPVSGQIDVEQAIAATQINNHAWREKTTKDRIQVLISYHQLFKLHTSHLAKLINLEHGKNILEAQQEIAKANETTEWAIGLPEASLGGYLEVSRGVSCRMELRPLSGVVVTIVPFNFPCMVPHWTLAISLAMGNAVILKPSEKVPLTMLYCAHLLKLAGLPDGIFNIVNGDASTVKLLLKHEKVAAFTFVGTTHVARLLSGLPKRSICLGGAKNHLVAHPDANVEMTSTDVVASFTGCTGQRCMAASVLLLLPGNQTALLDAIVRKASALKPGIEAGQIGPVIDETSARKITKYIDDAVSNDVKVLLDGRSWKREKGHWIGPTILLHTNKNDAPMREEVFGPVLSIYQCLTNQEALEIENTCPYGNAACIYTTSGGVAEYFTKRFSAGMVGVNVGVPVPREPFSFGGIMDSKFGSGHDITGRGAMTFFSQPIKVTTKWAPPSDASWMN
jgi:malonate-semialdehyde dehydrogenase (acetylating)/methylmalonate-semialdehyde dehydrogenase